MTDVSSRHPADSLAMALQRSQVLLSTIGELYDAEAERFIGGEAFAAHAVTTVTQMLNEAKNALTDLHFNCDLTLLDQADSDEENYIPDSRIAAEVAREYGLETSEMTTSDDIQNIHGSDSPPSSPEFAQSYLELLRKLTAAEVFAAESQALSAPGTESELLPLLKSLREDLQRIHSAA